MSSPLFIDYIFKKDPMEVLDQCIQELNQLIQRGDTLKAMQLYYSDEVIMQENEDTIRTGKQSCIENELKNLSNITELKCRLIHQAIDYTNQVVFSEWEIIFVTLTGQPFKLLEVSVQEWQENKIIKEKFYYKEIKRM